MKFGIKKRDDAFVSDIDHFRKSISDLFEDFFSISHGSLYESDYVPAVDVKEDDKNIYVKADIPGIDEKNLSVNIENNILTIKGEKSEEKREEKNKKVLIMERKYGAFQRSIRLPDSINSEGITANFKNGVLSIGIPKEKTEEPKKVKISIK
ncbi:MAG TPA: Hsp20/alpha crystallin family protein [Spirochaetota bacterium]|nr:Hsp20/alpha crystallin family protein [Spirochaetota bacterium]HOD16519.1 Hsp20/alpha crystallin family protein [Spirochaetota bacterium]HPG50764.1 Hsp20/alpha crystallin family protein [Spirochaetota bacterium]HPN14084.1 Hsp20/alpha crystallin family protein [Spirochaetota bacterium]HQL83297.1 Hsp20/alpha crystallin family protein [Spirochaetota bacterium]